MNLRPHTEHPHYAPQSCLIACADSDEGGSYFLLPDLYIWDGSKFLSEETGETPIPEQFWWISESEVLEGLPK